MFDDLNVGDGIVITTKNESYSSNVERIERTNIMDEDKNKPGKILKITMVGGSTIKLLENVSLGDG